MDNETRITVTDGPYLVRGDVTLVRRRIVYSEHGEPLTWETTLDFDAPMPVALCRCGGSNNKPFCDGTHNRNGFDGTPTAPATTYDERQRTYEATGMVMRDDRSICTHAGFCGNRLTNVWKLARGEATEDSIVRLQLMNMIERCPSGALTFRLRVDGDDIEPPLRTEVSVTADGPLAVSGGIPVALPDGTALEARNRQTLCRCGASSNKPLCDGTHKEIGFTDS